MSASTTISSVQPNVTLALSAKAQEAQQSAEPKIAAEQKQAREAAVTREAIEHIPMEPGAIIGLTTDLNAERNSISLEVALMRHKQENMETVLDGLKRSGN